jgi:hypothetical protein
MAQRITTGIGTGVRELVAPGVLEDSGRQVRGQALDLNTQVLAPLEQTETLHGPGWTGLAREQYLGLHQGVVQALQQTQVRVDGLGAAMGRSAAGYERLTHTRFGPGGPAASGAGVAALPTETEYVSGITKPMTPQEVRDYARKSGIQGRALTDEEMKSVRDAERARSQAISDSRNAPTDMSTKCWAADETGGPSLVSDAIPEDDIPSGYAPREYPQLTPDVKGYADSRLGPHGYTLPTHQRLDTYMKDGQVIGGPGYFAASHAEKQASVRGAFGLGQSKRIGVNLAQCRDCRRYFQAAAQERNAMQFVADPYLTRIYYPNGDIGLVLAEGDEREVFIVGKQQATADLARRGARLP